MAIIRPSSDILTGWSPTPGGTSYTTLDETTADNADYISASSAGLITRVGLGSTTDPGVDTGHVLRYRAASDGDRGLIAKVVQTGSFPFIVTSKQPWRSQPQVPVRIADAYADAKRVWLPNSPLNDLNNNSSLVLSGTTVLEATPSGIGIKASAYSTKNYYSAPVKPLSDWPGLTTIVVLTVNTAVSNSRYPTVSANIPTGGGNAYGGWNLAFEKDGAGALYGYMRAGNNSTGAISGTISGSIAQRIVLIGAWNKSTVSVLLKGTVVGNSYVTAASPNTWATGDHVETILGSYYAASYRSCEHSLLSAVVLPRFLPVEEQRSIANNPWQIFRPRRQISYVDLGRKVIAERTPTLTTSPADYTINLSEAEAATITDYSALAVEVEST